MKKHLVQFVDKYVKAINSQNAAIFAGAGLSIPTGLVDWKDLMKDIADEINLDIDKEDDLISVAQYYENHKGGRGSINNHLIQKFTEKVKESKNHRILASLPIGTFWTTNYDNLIETTLNKYGKVTDVKRCMENLAVSVPKRDAIIYKMHGDISMPHEAVLTKDDYESYNKKRQLFTTALQGDLVSKTFLFIGFSFEDPNLEYILSRIRILLGNHVPEHFCFFKTLSEEKYDKKEDYLYDKVLLEHKIRDLTRYGIQALMIDDYDEVTQVLELIKIKIKRKNIFISGAAAEYGNFNKIKAENLIFKFSKELAKRQYKIISGFGLGIGSSVINGVLSQLSENNSTKLDDHLILRPFPQNIPDPDERKKLWKKYREAMLSEAGIAIFFFGNKLKDGEIVNSDGLIEEFEIAVKLGLKVVPVGCTGYVAKDLWDKLIANYEQYYPNSLEIKLSMDILGNNSLKEQDIINHLIKIINLLQNNL
jgi:hypothetical protein